MDYQKIYNKLIERSKDRTIDGYFEKHHVIPKSLGGTDDHSNIVILTPEEHYLAHQLLVRITNYDPRMVKAAIIMCRNRATNKLYGWLRRRFSEIQSKNQSGTGNSMYGKRWIANEYGTKLVPTTEADNEIKSGTYITGKKAVRAQCGCLVPIRCKLHENKYAISRLKMREEFIEKTKKMFDEFIQSDIPSITKFAKLKNTSQPALTKVWKKHIPEYSKFVKHGKSFKKGLTKD